MKNSKLIFSIFLIALGILFRTIWYLGPNVEFVTSATLLAGAYLGKKWAFIVPVSIMAVSDLVLGNTNIFLFTWSGYLMIGFMGYKSFQSQKSKVPGLARHGAGKSQNYNSKFKIIKAMGLGAAASLWFFIWTNFGVWLLDSWGMYPKTLSGLIDAYIMGLPFLKYNLLGNLVLVPLSFTSIEVLNSKCNPDQIGTKLQFKIQN